MNVLFKNKDTLIFSYFIEKVAVSHIDINLAADFKNEKLKGFVDLSITKVDDSCEHIVW